MDEFAIWKRTLAIQGDEFDEPRLVLRQAFLEFRSNVALLVQEIGGLLPDLTVHDISHLDALWRVADQIAGPDFPLNPAEAFVLGGAILLHDSAHVLAAYENGLAGVQQTTEWKDLIAQRFGNEEPSNGSKDQKQALFQVLRLLHAKQARQLPSMEWGTPGVTSSVKLKLLSHPQLCEYYGPLIGELAESHHWPASTVGETFEARRVNPPAFLLPATWQVDALKIAFLLRTADAAHVDAQRAPWFLFALRQPNSVSSDHWRFQAKLGQPTRSEDGELRLTSGSPFKAEERKAWWLAYDTACMIDQELRDAQLILRDLGRPTFAATGVSRVANPASFAMNVMVQGWEPVNVAPKIKDVAKVISNLGGEKLYGDDPSLALREIIQNAADAVRALRAIGGLDPEEGQIEVEIEKRGDQNWIHVTDTGIGMSRHVLTEVLLDFGTSFWSSEHLRDEIPGLAASGFKPVGKFGIGFFSIFILGRKVIVNTRRYRRATSDKSEHWLLEFGDAIDSRPMLRQPSIEEELKRSGTRVSVCVDEPVLRRLLGIHSESWKIEGISHTYGDSSKPSPDEICFDGVVCELCPTIDMQVSVKNGAKTPRIVVRPNDWLAMESASLLKRLYPSRDIRRLSSRKLYDLVESDGEVKGRLRYRDGYFVHGIATHRGIQCGSVPNTEGVIQAENNVDLARKVAASIASKQAWSEWATRHLEDTDDEDIDAMTTLHPLRHDLDLPVFRREGKPVNLQDLKNWIATKNIVMVFDQDLEYEDFDDVSRHSFINNFTPEPSVIFTPPTKSGLAKYLDFAAIDYLLQIDLVLEAVWPSGHDWDRQEVVVGEVLGCEILRDALILTKL